jgi:hypothetical protein
MLTLPCHPADASRQACHTRFKSQGKKMQGCCLISLIPAMHADSSVPLPLHAHVLAAADEDVPEGAVRFEIEPKDIVESLVEAGLEVEAREDVDVSL